mmetsp:Transcript_18373/g.42549  ORF Transcript_18373/g.42549 Transcript_18373/m.42549 type:complete len:148 (+) Transcript_18373:1181-1624(+)
MEEGHAAQEEERNETHESTDKDEEEVLVQMLKREDELRRSSRYLDAMEVAEESADSEWMDVAVEIQHQVIQEFQPTSLTVHDLRLAALRHPELCFWVRHNRARPGHLRVGDVAPNVVVRRALDDSKIALLSEGDLNSTVVLVAGSLS